MAYNNSATTSSGTSFATPLAAGGVACLIQALPNKSLAELRDLLRENSSEYPNTTAQMGYGILNFGNTLNAVLATDNSTKFNSLKIYPNPVINNFTFDTTEKISSVELYDVLGRKLQSLQNQKTNSVEQLKSGVYFLKVKTDKNEYVEKIIKK